MKLRMRRKLLEQMLSHARAEGARECVGLLLGGGGEARELRRLQNISQEPTTGYLVRPQELLAVLREADSRGLEPVAIYHSHPSGPPAPSSRDRAEAVWDTVYVIIGADAEVRAYRLPSGKEVEIVIES